MKSERAWTALINYAPGFIEQVNAIGPATVSLLGTVVEAVDKGRKFDAKLAYAHARNLFALSQVLWTGKNDFIANVTLHLPNIAGMRFQNVHGVELHALTIFVVKLIERGNLPAKWRSRATAEDQHYGLVVTNRCQADVRVLIQGGKREVGRGVSDV